VIDDRSRRIDDAINGYALILIGKKKPATRHCSRNLPNRHPVKSSEGRIGVTFSLPYILYSYQFRRIPETAGGRVFYTSPEHLSFNGSLDSPDSVLPVDHIHNSVGWKTRD
jgi:hypothetical protein